MARGTSPMLPRPHATRGPGGTARVPPSHCTTHMSLQTPLKAFHHGSDSSVEVICWSMHF